jgi:hypothetical protein
MTVIDGDLWTLDQLAEQVEGALAVGYGGATSGRVRSVPDRRAIRWYATIGLIDRPAGMRGRTALYGARHLLQLVAIKRRQAAGRSLAEIQAELTGATDATLREIAQLPEGTQLPVPPPPAATPRARSFWSAKPTADPLNDPAAGTRVVYAYPDGSLDTTPPPTLEPPAVPPPDAAKPDAPPTTDHPGARPFIAAPTATSPSSAASPGTASPTDAAPSNAAPSNAAPSNAAPSNGAPSDGAPTASSPAGGAGRGSAAPSGLPRRAGGGSVGEVGLVGVAAAVVLGGGVTVVLPVGRAVPDAEGLRAIHAAAEPLLAQLVLLGVLEPAADPGVIEFDQLEGSS